MLQAERRDDVRISVHRLQELPPLSPDVQGLLAVLGDDGADLDDVARAIERVPALAARIVGLACSAYFGGGKVRSVLDAVVRVLGLHLVRSLAIGIAVGSGFDTRRCPSFSPQQHWTSALLCATLSRALGEATVTEEPVVPESAYLCGLIHNLGLLAMAHVAPAEVEFALQRAAECPERTLTEVEAEILGLHHCQVGAWLAMRWQLPPETVIVMQHHHNPDYRGPHWPLSLVVGTSVRWGRQRLAGVAEPWIGPDWLRALGMDESAFASRVSGCAARLDDIALVGKAMAQP